MDFDYMNLGLRRMLRLTLVWYVWLLQSLVMLIR